MTAVGCQAGGGVGEAPRGLLSPEAQFHGLLVWCDTDSEVHMENFSKGKQTTLPLHHSHCRCCQYHYQLMCSASPPPTPTRPLGGCVCVGGGVTHVPAVVTEPWRAFCVLKSQLTQPPL